ncbi:hypothetical protein LTR50_006982 [Elasticomyces elasticus]|nr:hypothetical protein LTR50_006982 [Elasticomyces elasticus]
MPAAKRPGEDAPDGTPNSHKAPRTDQPGDFASAVGSARKKNAASTRTGQACDRCKIRKIRCDGRLGGCSPCVQNNTECKTTDRITGRATIRGHTEALEQENYIVKAYSTELIQQLRDNGIEPKAPPVMPGYYAGPGAPQPNMGWPSQTSAQAQQGWDMAAALQSGSQLYVGQNYQDSARLPPRERAPSRVSLPFFRTGCIGDNYLGVSSQDDWLSPIKGTSLALFGSEIDLAEFMPPDVDDPASPASYQTFLAQAWNKSSSAKQVQLPEYDRGSMLPEAEVCKTYVEWHFRSIGPYLPIVHKPHMMDMLNRIHHDNYQPTAAETVMVHMILANIIFQFAARNGNEDSLAQSNAHYHYALTFFYELVKGHTLQDIQALACICMHLRSLPKPGAAWFAINLTLGLAIELGLHRSVKNWSSPAPQIDQHEAEMRKRVFYSVLLLHGTLSGKLGRPMPLHFEDYDVEVPSAVPDCTPEEEASGKLSEWRKCSFRVGIESFRLLPIMMRTYSTVHAVRGLKTSSYESTLAKLDKDLSAWRSQIPPELRDGQQTSGEDRIAALYLQVGDLETRLNLHHPALCRSTQPEVIGRNLDVCLSASTKLLHVVSELRKLNGLDTTWYNTTVSIAAIFTTLFVYSQRKDTITSAELGRVRSDMDLWLEIMGDIGTLLGRSAHAPEGSGLRLRTAIGNIIDAALNDVHRHLAAKTASAAVATADINRSPAETAAAQEHAQHAQAYGSGNTYNVPYPPASSGVPTTDADAGAAYMTHDESSMSSPQNTYSATTHYNYPEPPSTSIPNYPPSNIAYDNSGYPSNEVDVKPDMTAQLHQQYHQQPQRSSTQQQQYMNLASSPPQSGTPTSTNTTAYQHNQSQGTGAGGPAAWRHFTDHMLGSMGPGEFMNSASALMALGAQQGLGEESTGNAGATGEGHGLEGLVASTGEGHDGQSQPWPLMTYAGGNRGAARGGHGGQ